MELWDISKKKIEICSNNFKNFFERGEFYLQF